MKRSLAALLSISLVVVSAPIPAWSQVAAAVSGGAASAPGAAAGAARASVRVPALSLPSSALSAPGLTGALAAPLAPAVAPAAALSATPSLAVAPAALAAASKPAKPVSGPVAAEAKALAAANRETLAAAAELGRAPSEGARTGAARIMDRLLGIEEAAAPSSAVEAAGSGVLSAGLSPASAGAETRAEGFGVPSPSPAPQGPRRSKLLGALKAVGVFAGGAALTLGAQAAAVALLPAIFGVVPAAAVWAVASGALIYPLALYARARLALRDSPRLDKVKTLLDFSLGAFAGALFIAAPSLVTVLGTAGLLTAATPLVAVLGGRWLGGTAFADSILVWAALGLTPLALSAASAAGLIGLSPIIGMMALPAMTTIAFFLGRLIHAAETGAPFAVPGSMQRIRFPSFQWVMIGVVFALLTGYSAVHSNIAFLVWTLLGGREGKSIVNELKSFKPSIGGILKTVLSLITFDRLFLGLLAYTAFTGFASPLTFLVLAFAGERASVWTERLLTRFLPRGQAAPSTKAAPVQDPELLADKPAQWPNFHYWTKTFLLIGSMAATGFLLAATVFGFSSLAINLGIASLMAFVPFFFAKKIIKAVMKAEPTTKEQDPEFFAIMEELRDKLNAERRAKGKKEIPMPEMVLDPMMAPNAYATGRSPFHAMVGVTRGIKAMTLEPETVREGVTRLLAGVEPNSKAFRVFRLAIQGSLTGVPADGTPAQVAAVVLKAPREELYHLGYRMLRGVLGHEFSHVMDRHMLSGSIAGAIASGVAFASYGVMWAVGHAQLKAKEALDRVLGRETPAPERKSKGEGAQPHAFEPITTGIAVKSLPALLKLLAALWAPIVLQVTQMASSRNNEGMADEDGALLSEDPESLALGLGLLTTWRPPQGFVIPGATLPRAAALQHIMTVNPLDQLDQAGMRPALGASGAPTKADDFLFEMFITHPNTGTRIEKLHDMSRAMKGTKIEKPRLPSDSGGGGGGPLAFAPTQNSASGRIGGGLLRGAWEALKRPFRVLPDEDRNRQFWTYTLGQALLMVGVNFHYTSLPRLVAPEKSQTDLLGYNRAINWGAQAASSLATGPLVDRSSSQSVIVWTYLGRALLMAAIPVLFFTGHFGFAAFTALIAIAGFLQMTGMTAGSVVFNRILGEDQAHYNRANAVYNIVLNIVGVLAPLAAGAFIALADARWGLLSGNALSYGIYGAIMLAVAVGYQLYLKPPRDEMMAARRALHAKLKAEGVGPVRYAGVTAGRADGAPALVVEVDGDPALAVLPREFDGYAVVAAPKRRVVAEMLQGFRVIAKDRFLRIYLLSLTLSVAASDALIFAAIPRFIADILGAGAGSFGLFLAASALGMGVGAAAMALGAKRKAEDEIPDAKGLDKLQRQGRWSSWVHGLSWLVYAAIFLTGSVSGAAGLMLVSALLAAPGLVVWSSLVTRVVAGRYPHDQGKVYSAMYFYQLFFSIAGVLLFGWLMSFLPTMTVLWLAAAVMAACALVDFVVPSFIFPLDRKR